MKTKDNKENIEDIKAEALFYKRHALNLVQQLKESRDNIETSYRSGYVEGWNACTKKIRNFIIKHCQDYFTYNDEKEYEIKEKINKLKINK